MVILTWTLFFDAVLGQMKKKIFLETHSCLL